MTTLRTSADVASNFVMPDAGTLGGFRSGSRNQLGGDPTVSPKETATAIYGAWDKLILCAWGGLDLLANPYEATVSRLAT